MTCSPAVELVSPAKLNLFLEIRGLRDDGYHELETVMQTVSLCDRIMLFEIDNGIELTANADWIPAGADNLAWQAADLFFKQTGIAAGVRIEVDKQIPAGGGFGGGSSNAASVLLGLNQLFSAGISMPDLAHLAASIGSDVPFFIYGGTALCTGRGECIEPLDIQHSLNFLIAMPELHAATAAVYGYLQAHRLYPDHPCSADAIIRALQVGDPADISRLVFNRLESAALGAVPELQAFKQRLDDADIGPFTVTGSGAGLFRVEAESPERDNRVSRVRAVINGAGKVFECQGNNRGINNGNNRS